jgi:hypothetical protein
MKVAMMNDIASRPPRSPQRKPPTSLRDLPAARDWIDEFLAADGDDIDSDTPAQLIGRHADTARSRASTP